MKLIDKLIYIVPLAAWIGGPALGLIPLILVVLYSIAKRIERITQ